MTFRAETWAFLLKQYVAYKLADAAAISSPLAQQGSSPSRIAFVRLQRGDVRTSSARIIVARSCRAGRATAATFRRLSWKLTLDVSGS